MNTPASLRPNLGRICKHPARLNFVCRPSVRLLSTFQEGDIVLLREKNRLDPDGHLSKPLRPSDRVKLERGAILHDDIIGRCPRDLATSSKQKEFRIHEPTIAEYVRLTPRLVTPIYSADANLIVSLLDLHINPPDPALESTDPIEILEVGTGHGSLTLHLSRAIHGANPHISEAARRATTSDDVDNADLEALHNWKKSRGAVVHTVDVSKQHSTRARQTVQNFRRGMYYHNVEFNVGYAPEWLKDQRQSRASDEPFLSHALIDIPEANKIIEEVTQAVRPDGIVTVFVPNVTQIVDCVNLIRGKKLPLIMDDVVQLGGSASRSWEVRSVRTRQSLKMKSQQTSPSEELANEEVIGMPSTETAGDGISQRIPEIAREWQHSDEDSAGASEEAFTEWATICRPKVNMKSGTGGFLGVWRKMKHVRISSPDN